MTPPRQGLLSLCAASLLVLGACSGGNKLPVEEITVEAASLDLSGADAKALERHFQITARRGSESDALAALDGLGLSEVTEGRVIDGSTVTYTDWRATDGDSEVTAGTVILRGVHESEEGATFDAIEMSDIRLLEYGDDNPDADAAEDRTVVTDGTIETLVLVEPTAEFAADIIAALRGEEAVETPDPMEALDTDLDFRGLRVEGLSATVNEGVTTGTISLGQLVFGQDEKDDTLDVIIDTVAYDMATEGAPEPITLRMDGLTALGVQVDMDDSFGVGNPLFAMGALSPRAEPPYREVDFGAMTLNMSAFDLNMDGFEAKTEKSGDRMTLQSVLAPMVLRVKDATGTPLAPFMDVIRANDLDEITMKGSQTSTFDRRADRVSVTDSQFEIDGGLRFDCDYAVEGLRAAADALEASGATPPDFTSFETEEEIDAYLSQLSAYETAMADANANIKMAALDCVVQDVPDNSLVDRAYAVASEVTGRPVPVLKGSAKTMIALSSLTAQSDFQRDLMDTLGTGLIDFLDTPGQTMQIRIAPDQPVAITTFTGTDASLDGLNLTVEVK
jgi:hypothetical protein